MPDNVEDLKARRDEGYAFCKAHLAECCQELLEWHDTSLLKDGYVRRLAREYFSFAGEHALGMAESTVHRLAMQHVAGK